MSTGLRLQLCALSFAALFMSSCAGQGSIMGKESVCFDQYCLGMSYRDFEKAPPDPSDQNIPPQAMEQDSPETNSRTCNIDLASLPPFERRGEPTFLFFKNGAGTDYQLIAIYGNIPLIRANEVAGLLEKRYGSPKTYEPLDLHNHVRYQWAIGDCLVTLTGKGGRDTLLQFENKIQLAAYESMRSAEAEKKQKEQAEAQRQMEQAQAQRQEAEAEAQRQAEVKRQEEEAKRQAEKEQAEVQMGQLAKQRHSNVQPAQTASEPPTPSETTTTPTQNDVHDGAAHELEDLSRLAKQRHQEAQQGQP